MVLPEQGLKQNKTKREKLQDQEVREKAEGWLWGLESGCKLFSFI